MNIESIAQKNINSRFWVGVLILIIANMGFSSKAVLIKLMFQYHVDVISVMTLRMLFSLPFFIIVAFLCYLQKDNVPLTLKEGVMIGGLGILSYYISSMLDFMGLQYISASVERLILFTYPTMVLLISSFFFKKKVTKIQYIAMVLTYVGVVIAFVAEKGLGHQTDIVKGVFLVLTCAFTYSFYVVGTGELVHRFGSLKFSSYAMIAATAPILIQSYIHNGINIFHYDKEVYMLSIWLVLAATVAPIFLIVEGIRIVGASNSSIIGFVGPVFTIFLAYFCLNEAITFFQILGTSIVLLGVFLISWKGKN